MPIEALEATTADGLTLRGELVRGGEIWTVLVHDAGSDIDEWASVRPLLSARGWTVLALDLRGHGGSDGDWDPARAPLDVDLGVTLARRLGARHVSVLAGGAGGVYALRAVERALAEESAELPDSLVLLSPGPLEGADPLRLRGAGLPKLVFSGAGDPYRGDAEALRRASIGWTLGVSVATDARGAALATEWSAVVVDKMRTFLAEQAAQRGMGERRHERRRAVARPGGPLGPQAEASGAEPPAVRPAPRARRPDQST